MDLGTPNKIAPEYNGPVNFSWLIPGLLGGTPRPGIFKDVERDIAALKRVETKLLVTLTEEWQPDPALNARYGIETIYEPMPDLNPPTIEQAISICRRVAEFTQRGEAAVFHCHAGKGRTGTLLASMLIWSGQSAHSAITNTRAQNSKWIESESQLAFLSEFAALDRSMFR